jgi:hypothetical protein
LIINFLLYYNILINSFKEEKMNKIISFTLIMLIHILSMGQENPFPKLTGPYLGQEPPGMTPKLFAPGIICTDQHEGSSGFALKGTVYIFQKFINRKCHTYIMRLKDNVWIKPQLIPFWEQLIHNGDFVFSPDDATMLYQVKTEKPDGLVSNIWKVSLINGEWGKRTPLPAPINTRYDESFASEANNKNLYFFSRRPGGKGKFDLYMVTYKNGKYSDPINIEELNTEHHEWDPYIAPDESYLIFCSTKSGGLGGDDFYISFKTSKNKWSKPLNMGDKINSPRSDNRPYVTHDGQYFFYTSSKRGNRDIYWVDIKFLDQFRPI